MAKVAISKLEPPVDEDKVYETVKNAVDLLGGIEKFVKPGEKVLIKPNLVRPAPPPTTTDRRVIRAVALLVKEAGGKPIIGEGTAAMTLLWREEMDSDDVLFLTGMYKIAEEVGGEVVPFDKEGKFYGRIVDIPGGVVLRKANIAEIALEVDKIIPVPVMKCSMEGGGVTLCIKDLHALVDPYTDRLKFHRSDLWQKLVDIVKVVRDKIKLCVIDGIKAMEGDGPIYGDPVDMNVILAGDDPVATDAIGSLVMGFDDPLREIGPIAIAHADGLGIGDPSKIEVVGAKIEDVRKKLKKASCEILAGIFPNIVFIEGGCCRACKAWIKFTLYALKGEGVLDKEVPKRVGKLVFIAGVDPSLPEDPKELLKMGLPIVFGDCALYSTKSTIFWQLREKAVYIPGCPPFAVGNQARLIKKAMGLPITKREAWGFLPTYTH